MSAGTDDTFLNVVTHSALTTLVPEHIAGSIVPAVLRHRLLMQPGGKQLIKLARDQQLGC